VCLAVPAEVKRLDGEYAEVDYGGAKSRVNISLVEGVSEGDYVIVHVGYAIQRLTKEEAEETLRVWEELLEAEP
jgi:hydrogenase expression/formation protein HypC